MRELKFRLAQLGLPLSDKGKIARQRGQLPVLDGRPARIQLPEPGIEPGAGFRDSLEGSDDLFRRRPALGGIHCPGKGACRGGASLQRGIRGLHRPAHQHEDFRRPQPSRRCVAPREEAQTGRGIAQYAISLLQLRKPHGVSAARIRMRGGGCTQIAFLEIGIVGNGPGVDAEQGKSVRHAEKLSPHEQCATALGFVTLNPPFCRSSL